MFSERKACRSRHLRETFLRKEFFAGTSFKFVELQIAAGSVHLFSFQPESKNLPASSRGIFWRRSFNGKLLSSATINQHSIRRIVQTTALLFLSQIYCFFLINPSSTHIMKPAESPELITKFINFRSTWQCFRTIHTVDFTVCSSQCSRRSLTQTSRYRVIYHRRWFIPEDLLAPIMAGQIIFRTPDRQHGSLHSCVLMYTEVVSLSFSNWKCSNVSPKCQPTFWQLNFGN